MVRLGLEGSKRGAYASVSLHPVLLTEIGLEDVVEVGLELYVVGRTSTAFVVD